MFRANIYRTLNGRMLYYNAAAGSFHIKKLCSRLYSMKLNFIIKKQNGFFESPFGGLRVNICTLSIARWKARGRLPIRHFCYLLRLRRYERTSVKVGVFRKGVGQSLWAQISDGKGHRPPTTLCQKTRVIALSCGIKIFAVHCLILSQSTPVLDWRMDGRTDGQNCDSQDRVRLAAVKTYIKRRQQVASF